MLAAPSTSSQPADLLQILTSNTSPSSSSTSHPSSSSAVPSNNNITSSNTTAVDTTNHPQQIPNLMCKSLEQLDEEGEPEIKRRKTGSSGQMVTHEKLESRLNGILCCAVCLDLPKNAIYQVGTPNYTFHGHTPSPHNLPIVPMCR